MTHLTSAFFYSFLFFFNDTATTEIYTLSLHDALPICPGSPSRRRRPESMAAGSCRFLFPPGGGEVNRERRDRKSTRLNSSHVSISYAVFCLKKKKKTTLQKVQHYRS